MRIPPQKGEDLSDLSAAADSLGTDVLAMQEVDHGLGRSKGVFQARDIATRMGALDWAFAPAIIGSPEGKWHRAEIVHFITN